MPIPKLMLCLLAATALVVGGCGGGDQRTKNPGSGAPTPDDAAYAAVAAAQIDAAIDYSNAILKTTSDADVKRFARAVLDERTEQQKAMTAITASGEPVNISDAARDLNIPVEDLAISATGSPLVAPSSDSGYVKAIRSVLNGSIRAAEVEKNGGTQAETVQLASRIYSTANAELEQLKSLP